ncbi:MAG: hypothetical protein Q7R77_03210 [Candidatus Daviesbacteria bacterium]|nr:hypothetical protein [Candidatus Daviesbacteria bacterium]
MADRYAQLGVKLFHPPGGHSAIICPGKNMELLVERGTEKYDGIADPGFCNFIEGFDSLLEKNKRGWPMRISDFLHNPYPRALRLRAEVMRWLLADVRKEGIMDLVRSSVMHGTVPDKFDKERCLAFGALVWVIAERRYEVSRETLPWESIVTDAKSLLGEHPLTEYLHHPNENHPVQSGETIVRPRRRKPKVKIVVDENLVRIVNKFPVFDQEGQASVEKMDIDAVTELLTGPPDNSLDGVNPIRHASDPVIQAVVFILKANSYRLASYKQYKEPYEEPYSLFEFRRGLELCLGYLTENINIRNVYQLVKAVERAVRSDPLKYWNSKKSSDPGSG